ncbi:MAG: 30S ribosomal protein S12 methylthiotransferase RimO [Propionibacteriaceae bacterium]|nr:30S ribosomal protein S12 methylthiotransferase RimO [Propionibacteriaceae bacterium]
MALHLVGLGCARNDVDSEELAGRFAAAGFDLVGEPGDAEVVVVNTCGFIDAAKRDSIDQILAAADLKGDGHVRAVVAAGCLAERYGAELAEALPEADAIVGFDGYADIAETVRTVLAGGHVAAHPPRDRRALLPLAPAERQDAPVTLSAPYRPARKRLSDSPMAPLKIASGCDRRCAFCAIPSFRGAFLSRPRDELVAEARWLAGQGVKELFLVSENTTSYGKDLAEPLALPRLLRDLSAVDGIEWIRLSYLQPAELRPELIDAIAATDKVVPYFDLPFQHASGRLLRRMRRFGDAASFLGLLDQVRAACPDAGVRSNVIVGFPGETAVDVAELEDFLAAAELDAIGVFGYSDEAGTEGATLDGHLDDAEIAARVAAVSDTAEVLMAERARRWVGGLVDVLLERPEPPDAAAPGVTLWAGRTAQQGPEADGETFVAWGSGPAGGAGGPRDPAPGVLVRALVRDTDGVDLSAAAEWPQM